MLRHYLNLTGSNPDALMWMLHDFGFRGVSSPESAAWGSFAHLTTGFRGTDTMFALIMGKEFYDEPCAGYSIPAYEHSTVTSWGRNREIECYRHALQVHPKGPLSVVSDSYNFFNAVENIWGGLLRDEVLSRDGRLVIRPDSFEDIPAGVRRTLDILGQKFPTTVNEKGYRVLHPKIRIIQGDGVDQETAKAVLKAIIVDDPIHGKWAAENVCFGMGGALLQKVNRDTLKFAFKCWMALVNGERVAVYKQPEGMEFKKSKAGEHKLVLNNGKFQTVPLDADGDNILRTVFYNGDLPCCWSLEQIRERADLPMGIIGY
jgi:nicotinamide phosphoribosyltransferase